MNTICGECFGKLEAGGICPNCGYENKKSDKEVNSLDIGTMLNQRYIMGRVLGVGGFGITYKNKIRQRTIDHSVPQMLVLSKQLKEKQIRFHEDRNRLLRVLGMESEKQVFEIMPPMDVKGRQKFLMCTDGFWEYVFEKDIQKLAKKSKTADEWVETMKSIVLENGKGHDMDNYSAIAVWVD